MQQNVKGQGSGQGQGQVSLGFFYFVLNSPILTRDVTCSVTLLGRKKYEEAMSDEHPPSKISLTILNPSDTNCFRDAFDGEITFIASFVPNCFSSTLFFKVLVQVSNLNLSNSLLKSEDIAKVHDQNLLHATLLKAVFPLPEEFQCNISAEIKIWWQCSSTVDTNSTGASPFS